MLEMIYVSLTQTGQLEILRVATPALLCHKETAQGTQSPDEMFLPFAVFLWHKSAYNRTYPLGLWMPELVLYGIRELA